MLDSVVSKLTGDRREPVGEGQVGLMYSILPAEGRHRALKTGYGKKEQNIETQRCDMAP